MEAKRRMDRNDARGRRGLRALIMTLQITDGPEFWRQRAEEARAVAVQMTDAHTKATMLGIAQAYDKLAEQAERRAQ
jgi:hypothetical protein